ncbi:MAG: hypothetical protein KDB00_24865 [Planctomycetales bacterium]|nr:hypothetical protein [Planctomycetales bacterium]
MPEIQPPADDNATLDQAQPYRSPANVTERSAKAGVMKSPIAWLVVLGMTAATAAGASMYLLRPVRDFNEGRRPVKPLEDYVEDFGIYRRPVNDLQEYEMGEGDVLSPDLVVPVTENSTGAVEP